MEIRIWNWARIKLWNQPIIKMEISNNLNRNLKMIKHMK